MFFRKILLDENGDKLQKNNTLIKRKEEATSTAREEIKLQTAREMQLAGEVEQCQHWIEVEEAALTKRWKLIRLIFFIIIRVD